MWSPSIPGSREMGKLECAVKSREGLPFIRWKIFNMLLRGWESLSAGKKNNAEEGREKQRP